nr:transposase [Pseudomonas paralcaligenes]
MSNQRYPKEFKIEAFKQVTKCGFPVAEVAGSLSSR